MSLFAELKRRNVFRVGIAYVVAAWLLLQLTEVLTELLELSTDIGKIVIILLIVGFVPALIFAWAFEMTPEGLKREREVDRDRSITRQTGRKLNNAILVLMALAIAYLLFDRFQGTRPDSVSTPAATVAQPAIGPETEPAPGARARAGPETSRQSIAVLPFANRSNVDEDLYFTDGIHDDLLTQLAKVDGLKVISRTSVMEYRNTTKKIPEIAAELGVAAILEGGIQRAGQRIRINAQLIDVATDEHVWAETFDRKMTVENIFDIQSEITRAIVSAVRGEMSVEELAASRQAPTEDLQAYEHYLRARAASQEPDYTIEKYLRAQEWAEQAVALDPGFAWAWSILVEAHCQSIWIGYDASPERYASARLALERATAGDPGSAEALTARGEYLYRIENDYPAALEAFRGAAAKQPGNSAIMVQMALTQRRLGTWAAAIDSYEKALLLDPGNRYAMSDYLRTLKRVEAFDKAIPIAEEAVRRFPEASNMRGHLAEMYLQRDGDLARARTLFEGMKPAASDMYVRLAWEIPLFERDYAAALAAWEKPQLIEFSGFAGGPRNLRELSLAQTYLAMGDEASARRYLEAFSDAFGAVDDDNHRNDAQALANLALARALMGDEGGALEASERAVAIMKAGTDRFEEATVIDSHAMVLALVGRRDEAIALVERQLGVPGSTIRRWPATLDPRWDFLRDDERFAALIRPEGKE
ncbi:MAG: tetratricopeptide repeat protein [Xanthomonadales bacterium]|nr:tetratricopeptide repeat protein [Xanthomonadales bacterium]NIN60179.1 tetratricopeptide repeat protein [Xanthomonadales bacterium]NIN75545.1 tetratricopeptide repeat protein [Xanthomonadales bacterium]NIO12836.1 tetratricopeptide repeat protein [Xanthomonadales bacterium]NIP12572.1 tetratricopeptide repeat protein [Xanthomonadales bacterium]